MNDRSFETWRGGIFPPVAALLAAMALLWAAPPAQAQETGTITGTVVEADTERPLEAVQVFIPGTGVGALTNQAGRFLLMNVPPGEHTIRAELVGHRAGEVTVTVPAGESVVANLQLRQTAIALDQIVVTGAGQAVERQRLGNTIASLDMEGLREMPIGNMSEILTGREVGVVGLPSGGLPGTGARIRIRGSASLSQSNEPIVYIDGVRVDNSGGMGATGNPSTGPAGDGSPSRLDDINPESIERIEILKGAAAATLYGTEASNGVIQIFTKQGQAGAPRWNLRVEQGFSTFDEDAHPPHAGFVMDEGPSPRPHGTDIGAQGVREFYGIDVQPFEVFEVNQFPELFETGHHQTYSLSVEGGSENITYFLSGRWQDDDGPFGAQQLREPGFPFSQDVNDRRQANANIMVFPTDNLRVRASGMYTEGFNQAPGNNNSIFGVLSSLLNSRPELASETNLFGSPAFATTRENAHRIFKGEVQRFAGSLMTMYTPTSNISLEATFGVDFVNQLSNTFLPFGWNVDGFAGSNTQGFRTVGNRNHREVSLDVKANWNTEFGENWSSSFVVGAQGFLNTTKQAGGTGDEFPAVGLETVSAAAIQTSFETFSEEANAGVFVQEQIGYRDWIFGTVGARYDEHSAFGELAGGELYPKASISVVPSAREGWIGVGPVSSLRVRAAVGQSGLQPGAFDQFTTFLPFAAETGPGVSPGNLGNPDLEPEVSTEWEVGAEVGLWDDRASFEVTYWDRTVENVLVDRQFPPSGGFFRNQLDNIGEMEAQGVELGLDARVISTRNYSLNLFANGSFTREEITDMGDAPPLKVGGAYPRYRQFTMEGHAPGSFFGPVLADMEFPIDIRGDCTQPTRQELLDFFSEPRSPDIIDPIVLECGTAQELRQWLGKPQPDWGGSFGGTLQFLQNFTLNANFEYRAGSYHIHDLSGEFRQSNPLIGRNIREAAEVEATLLNPASTPEQRLEAAQTWVRELKGLTPFDGFNAIHNADFIRLRELALTFRAPAEWAEAINANTLTLTASGRNIAMWTRFPGPDPELSQAARSGAGGVDGNFQDGVVAWGFPIPKRWMLSARVGF